MEYKKHKFNIFPEIDNHNYQELKNSISKGFDETLGKITLFENEILDGWNRYMACLECNTKPVFIDFKGSEQDAFEFSIKANQNRRHLTSSQLTTIAINAEPIWNEIQKKVESERIEKIRIARLKQEEDKRENERKEVERKQQLIRQENERIKRERELKERLQRESDLQKQKEIELEQLRIKKEREDSERLEKERIENEKKQKEIGQLIDQSVRDNSDRANSKLAEVFNTNRSYISDAKKIKEQSPEVFKKIESGELSIPEAKKQISIEKRQEDVQKQRYDIENNELTKLTGLYDIISIDPAWNYGREYDPENSRVANPYPEMTIEEIKALKLPVAENSIIFLWTTHKFLPDAFDILKHWDFDYKATLVWNKEKMGMGAWFRMQCEFCLFAIKGKPFWNNTTERDIISEGRREHSRKPDAFFEMVNKICAGRKLEYFAREKRDGWDVFGNDINKF